VSIAAFPAAQMDCLESCLHEVLRLTLCCKASLRPMRRFVKPVFAQAAEPEALPDVSGPGSVESWPVVLECAVRAAACLPGISPGSDSDFPFSNLPYGPDRRQSPIG